jgi:alpha-glucosidase (family GH31 glycosyl hydrolase)
MPKGKNLLVRKRWFCSKDSSQVTEQFLQQEKKLYGGGSRVIGMNHRGNRLKLYKKARYGYDETDLMNFCIPLVLSSRNLCHSFGNNPTIGYLNLDLFKMASRIQEALSGRKTYQVIIGDSWTNLIRNYTTLTGKQPCHHVRLW